MSGLKPCPFCGGEAHVKKVVSACETLYTVGDDSITVPLGKGDDER